MSVKPELRHLALILALPLAVAGCGKSDEGKQAVAAGEVLPGSVSDAMLPLDTLRSQPPLAPPVAAKSGPATNSSVSDDASARADDYRRRKLNDEKQIQAAAKLLCMAEGGDKCY